MVELHRLVLGATGGAPGIRDLTALESAIAQPKANFGGTNLYPTVTEKASALCFALVRGHSIIDGNERTGHAAMESFLALDGAEIDAPVDEQERLMLDLAASRISRSGLTDWLRQHVKPPM